MSEYAENDTRARSGQGRARENVHVMRLPAEQLQVKCRVSLVFLGHPNASTMSLLVFSSLSRQMFG